MKNILFALLFSQNVYSATYYVSLSGSDTNYSGLCADKDPATTCGPWRSIAYGASRLVEGDTLYVRGGTYNEGTISFTRSGTATAPITLKNYGDEKPIVDWLDKTNTAGRIILYAGQGNAIGWINVEGFELKNGYAPIDLEFAHDVIIRNNYIHHSRGGIGLVGKNITIDRNRIISNGLFELCAVDSSKCNQNHGIYAIGNNWKITNNIIADNQAYGIQLAGYPPGSGYPDSSYAGANNFLIANNTIAYHRWRSALVLWDNNGGVFNNTIQNNIFYENAQNYSPSANGIEVMPGGGGVSGNVITHNISYGSSPGSVYFLSGGTEGVHYTQSSNCPSTITGNCAVKPEMANAPYLMPTLPDFHLVLGSSAIDSGVFLSQITTDIDGNKRPMGIRHDIGAYEFSATVAVKPFPPKNLTAR
jgi:hypothetical protein